LEIFIHNSPNLYSAVDIDDFLSANQVFNRLQQQWQLPIILFKYHVTATPKMLQGMPEVYDPAVEARNLKEYFEKW